MHSVEMAGQITKCPCFLSLLVVACVLEAFLKRNVLS